jgi:small-conductance mechanosensitive channel
MDHTHHHFTWNVAAQTADRDLGGVFLGITVTIETWETYLAIGNVLNMRLIRRTGVGSWIRYRDTVVRIRSISIECVGLEHLNGDQFDLPTSSMRRMSEHRWSPKSVALYKMEVTVSRASDLRLVRDRVSSLLGDMAPSDSIKNNHIEFLDSSSSETTVSIKVVLPINNANRSSRHFWRWRHVGFS